MAVRKMIAATEAARKVTTKTKVPEIKKFCAALAEVRRTPQGTPGNEKAVKKVVAPLSSSINSGALVSNGRFQETQSGNPVRFSHVQLPSRAGKRTMIGGSNST